MLILASAQSPSCKISALSFASQIRACLRWEAGSGPPNKLRARGPSREEGKDVDMYAKVTGDCTHNNQLVSRDLQLGLCFGTRRRCRTDTVRSKLQQRTYDSTIILYENQRTAIWKCLASVSEQITAVGTGFHRGMGAEENDWGHEWIVGLWKHLNLNCICVY